MTMLASSLPLGKVFDLLKTLTLWCHPVCNF